MGLGLTVTIVVAAIGGGASVTGAIIASRAAARAAGSSEKIARQSHGVVAIDRQADQITEAFDKFILALGEVKGEGKTMPVIARLNQLGACQAATDDLKRACWRLIVTVTDYSVFDGVNMPKPSLHEDTGAVCERYYGALELLADKREKTLSEDG